MSQKEEILPNLYQRKKELEAVIKKTEKYVESPVEGYLEVNNNRNHYRYYYKEVDSSKTNSGKAKRKYIKDIRFAEQIAKHDYAKRVLKNANDEIKRITALINTYQKPTVEEIYKNLHPGRQVLVEPMILDDDQYAKQWLASSEKTMNSYPILLPIQTENHEIVRSKSEKIIADKLKLAGIPYIYEKPLRMGKTIKYPDFTVLNKRLRKEYYWEHMGLIDKTEYFKNAMEKIDLYSKNHIILGKNLIITYETVDYPLNVDMIDRIIQEYLL